MVRFRTEAFLEKTKIVFKIIAFFVIANLLFTNAFGQKILSGNVKDIKNIPIANANLLVFEKYNGKIIQYSSSDYKGNFSINYTTLQDTLMLEIRCLGFEPKVMTLIIKDSKFLEVILDESTQALKEVNIEDKRPILQKKDTLSYSVKLFSDESDRVISDVLKKLPGIKVSETGQITYQNKPINKFYIDGKDLLNNKYGIATNNLPTLAVDAIQVLQHHQPIKLLDGIEASDRAAINIKLNKSAKSRVIGNFNGGIGIDPLLRLADATILKFNNKIQYINTVKDNNIGDALNSEILQHSSVENYETDLNKGDVLSIVKASQPPIDNFRYRFNNSSLLDGNFLKEIGDDFEIKLSGAFVKDYLRETNSSITNFFLPNDTISIIENQRGSNQTSSLTSSITLQTNTKKAYLNNSFRWDQSWDNENNFISTQQITQRLSKPLINVVNDLNGIINFKGNLLGLTSTTNFTNSPQSLKVDPGQFSDLLNGSIDYDAVIQEVQSHSFLTNNTLSVTKKFGLFSFSNKFGMLLNYLKISNGLYKVVNSANVSTGNNFGNDISRNRLKINDESKLTFFKGRSLISFGVNIVSNNVSNHDNYSSSDANKFFLNPTFSFRYNLNSLIESSISLYRVNNITYNSNPSFILRNYRSLINSEVLLKTEDRNGINYSIEYKNIVNGIFSSLNANFSMNHLNVLWDTRFDGYYTTQSSATINNSSSNFEISFNINKYYAVLNSGIDLTVSFDKDRFSQLQNGQLGDYVNKRSSFESKIISKINKLISLEHNLDFYIYQNSLVQNSVKTNFDNLNFIQQKLLLKIFYPNKILTKFTFEHYFNNSKSSAKNNIFFADFTLQKTIRKPKMDFKLVLSNVFNTKLYTDYSYDNYTLVNSTYNLRGRSIMLKTSFQF
jgi:hypothetical protein